MNEVLLALIALVGLIVFCSASFAVGVAEGKRQLRVAQQEQRSETR